MITPILSPPPVTIPDATTDTIVLAGTVTTAGIHGSATLLVQGVTPESILTVTIAISVAGVVYSRSIKWTADNTNTPIPTPPIPMMVGTGVTVRVQSDTPDAITVSAYLSDVSGLTPLARGQRLDTSAIDAIQTAIDSKDLSGIDLILERLTAARADLLDNLAGIGDIIKDGEPVRITNIFTGEIVSQTTERIDQS